MTDAERTIATHNDSNALMTALDTEVGEGDQDWDHGTTTWTMADGSRVRVSGAYATALTADNA